MRENSRPGELPPVPAGRPSRLEALREARTMGFFIVLAAACALALGLLSDAHLLAGIGDSFFWICLLVLVAWAAKPRGGGFRLGVAGWMGIVLFSVGGAGLMVGAPVVRYLLTNLPVLLASEPTTMEAALAALAYALGIFATATALFLGALYLGRSGAPVFGGRRGALCILGALLGSTLVASLCIAVVPHLGLRGASKALAGDVASLVASFILFTAWAVAVKRGWVCLRARRRESRRRRAGAASAAFAALVALAGLAAVLLLDLQPISFSWLLSSLASLGNSALGGAYGSAGQLQSDALAMFGAAFERFAWTALAFLAVGLAAYGVAALPRRGAGRGGALRRLALLAALAVFCASCCEGLNIVLYRVSGIFASNAAYLATMTALNAVVVPVALAYMALASARLAVRRPKAGVQAAAGGEAPVSDALDEPYAAAAADRSSAEETREKAKGSGARGGAVMRGEALLPDVGRVPLVGRLGLLLLVALAVCTFTHIADDPLYELPFAAIVLFAALAALGAAFSGGRRRRGVAYALALVVPLAAVFVFYAALGPADAWAYGPWFPSSPVLPALFALGTLECGAWATALAASMRMAASVRRAPRRASARRGALAAFAAVLAGGAVTAFANAWWVDQAASLGGPGSLGRAFAVALAAQAILVAAKWLVGSAVVLAWTGVGPLASLSDIAAVRPDAPGDARE